MNIGEKSNFLSGKFSTKLLLSEVLCRNFGDVASVIDDVLYDLRESRVRPLLLYVVTADDALEVIW
jgi:hypothetical protein